MADSSKLQIIMMGDANLCAKKWKDKDFIHRAVAEEVISSLAQCGLSNMAIGNTYLADRLTKSGQTFEVIWIMPILVLTSVEDWVLKNWRKAVLTIYRYCQIKQ